MREKHCVFQKFACRERLQKIFETTGILHAVGLHAGLLSIKSRKLCSGGKKVVNLIELHCIFRWCN